MKEDWTYLTKLTNDQPLSVTKVRIDDSDVQIEGHFELPPLAKLSSDDQIFVAVFIRSHGSIKAMEKYFGVSYPTIKTRLNRIAEQFEFVNVEAEIDRQDPLALLESGEIDIEKAIDLLHERKSDD